MHFPNSSFALSSTAHALNSFRFSAYELSLLMVSKSYLSFARSRFILYFLNICSISLISRVCEWLVSNNSNIFWMPRYWIISSGECRYSSLVQLKCRLWNQFWVNFSFSLFRLLFCLNYTNFLKSKAFKIWSSSIGLGRFCSISLALVFAGFIFYAGSVICYILL